MSDQQDRELLLSIFLMEAWDTVAIVEDGLVHLPAAGKVADDARDSMMVVAHRLKGAAGLHGFTGIADLAGAMEAVLDESPAPPAGQAAAFLSDTVAALKRVLDAVAATGREDGAEVAALRARHPAAFAAPAGAATAPVAPLSGPEGDGLVSEMDRFFAENADILAYFGPEAVEHLDVMSKSLMALERAGGSGEELNTLFRAVHTLKGAAYTVGCTAVGNIAHQIEDLLGAVREGQVPVTAALTEAVFDGTDALRLLLGLTEGPPATVAAVVARARAGLRALMPAAPTAAKSAALEPATAVAEALVPRAEPAVERPERRRRELAPASFRSTIRVNLDRLDALMNLVGELVIARSRLDQRFLRLERLDELLAFSRSRMTQAVRDFEGKHYDPQLPVAPFDAPPGPGRTTAVTVPEARTGFEPLAHLFADLEFDRYDDFNILARSVGEISADLSEVQGQLTSLIQAIREDTGQIQRLTGSLRNEITRARMVPIGQLYARFARQVREASKGAGKTVLLEVTGESVEVDNSIIEQIADPLLHLIQNAITHGIEPEDERRARGKPAAGTVYMSAYHRGGSIYVEVEDDGRGIDVELVKTRAVQQGFVRPEAAPLLSEREALDLIFLPGFSTAAAVTTAAGRGVGMDVVRTNIARLNGEMDVETEAGVGTRFTIKLPLTVVIFDALLVRVSTETLAIPLNAVRLIKNVRAGEVQATGRSEMLRVEDQLVDLVRLDRALALPPTDPGERIPVLVLRSGGRSLAVAVDAILGKEEIVIKRLGGFVEGIGPFTGATISGEGRVILLLDPGRVFELSDAVTRAPSSDPVRRPEPVAGPAPRGRDSVRRVLLADDSISVRRFVGHMLEKAGFQVTAANDGAEALERATEAAYDVVITDLEMPRVNGYELIEDLRRRPSTRHLPVVVLTTRAGEKHLSLARRLGVKHYVTKPVEERAFVRLIQSLASSAETPGDAVPALEGTGR